MNGFSTRFAPLSGRAGLTAALFAAFALAGSVQAAAGPLQMAANAAPVPDVASTPMSAAQTPSSPKQATAPSAVSKSGPVERVETRIKDLHDKLKITKAQEDLWSGVARAMRDNAIEMEPLIKARSEHSGKATALEDLNSYSQLADAHADGLKKFVPAFAPLYASMSDIQKQNADTVFRGHGHSKTR